MLAGTHICLSAETHKSEDEKIHIPFFGEFSRKVACDFCWCILAQKSRGWLRFRRFFDENHRNDPNFFFKNFRVAEIFASTKNFRDERANEQASERTNEQTNERIAFQSVNVKV